MLCAVGSRWGSSLELIGCQHSQTCKLQVQWEAVPQRTGKRATEPEEDTWSWLLANTRTHTHMYAHKHEHIHAIHTIHVYTQMNRVTHDRTSLSWCSNLHFCIAYVLVCPAAAIYPKPPTPIPLLKWALWHCGTGLDKAPTSATLSL